MPPSDIDELKWCFGFTGAPNPLPVTGWVCIGKQGPLDNSSLLFLGWEPSEEFIQHSTFRHSVTGGIVSAWKSDAASPDLRATNEFDGIANGCEVSVNADADGICPDNGGDPSCCRWEPPRTSNVMGTKRSLFSAA